MEHFVKEVAVREHRPPGSPRAPLHIGEAAEMERARPVAALTVGQRVAGGVRIAAVAGGAAASDADWRVASGASDLEDRIARPGLATARVSLAGDGHDAAQGSIAAMRPGKAFSAPSGAQNAPERG